MCQLVHDVASEGDVLALERVLEQFENRMSALTAASSSSPAPPSAGAGTSNSSSSVSTTEHLKACAVVVQTKLDLMVKLRAHTLAVGGAPKSVNAEVVGLNSRLAVVEKELSAARAREGKMHLLLRKLAEGKPLPPQEPNALARASSSKGGAGAGGEGARRAAPRRRARSKSL
jgi:hypothetical protein